MIAEFQNGWEEQWPGGYTENFVVSEQQLGVSEKQVIDACIDPFSNPSGNAVEIGCGTGDAWSKKHLVTRFRYVTGVDVIRSDWVIDEESPKNFGYIRVSPNDYSLSMIEDGTVDFVFSFGCFGHLPRAAVAEYIQSAFRVLKPCSHAVFEFFATTRRMAEAYKDETDFIVGRPGTFVLEEDEPKKMVVAAGFERVIDLFPSSKTILLLTCKGL